MKIRILTACITTILLASGCGSDSSNSSNSNSPTVKQGYFVDSAVANIDYRTETITDGVTDANGMFSYLDGEHITFSIGEIELGSAVAQETITPLTLAGTDAMDNQVVVNISRLLQTLDDASDGSITIRDEVKNAAISPVNFAQSVESFAADLEVIELIATVNRSELISKEDAMDHLAESLGEEQIETNELVGSWLALSENDKGELLEISFLSVLGDGTYFAGQIEEPSYEDADFGGEASGIGQCYGFEFGEYTAEELTQVYDFMEVYEDFPEDDAITNPEVKVFDFYPVRIGHPDENICGFAGKVSAPDFNQAYLNGKVDISNIAFSRVEDYLKLYESEFDGDMAHYLGSFETLAITDNDPISGFWISSEHTKLSKDNDQLESNPVAVMFTSDGYYMYLDNAGVEVGTFTYNQEASTLTTHEISKIEGSERVTYGFDYNGDYGMSDFYDIPLQISLENDVATITIPENEGTKELTFIRE